MSRSSACEPEIHSTDECCKLTQGLRLFMEDLGFPDVKSPTEIYDDNRVCCDWTKGWANRKMRHMNIREMAVRESQLEGGVHVNHIQGKLNPSDLITKEHKNGEEFTHLCDLVVPYRSDGGCRIQASRILSPDLHGRADVTDDHTDVVKNEAIITE